MSKKSRTSSSKGSSGFVSVIRTPGDLPGWLTEGGKLVRIYHPVVNRQGDVG